MFPVRPQGAHALAPTCCEHTRGGEYWHDHKGGLCDRTSFPLGGLTPLCQTHQFQYRGDSQKGPVVTPQHAQAQAILQQTQVHAPLFIGTGDDV